MKKTVTILLVFAMALLLIMPYANAAEESTKIELSDTKITVNGEEISTDSSQNVYLTSKMDNGGTSSEAKEANVEVANIINITKAGTYEFTGTLTDGQISINANNVSGEVIILLNNANITCKDAPAIFVYGKDIENENCKVIIKTAKDTTNTLTGGKLKTSVEGWEDQDDLIYCVEKGYNDEHEYYERYKYDGAISADISLTFEGEGILKVVSTEKEGIEVKQDITINSGTLIVESPDDGINTCTDNESDITINGGTTVVKVSLESDEGDGIDSNGKLTVNGGSVYASAHPGSDNGLDASQGVYVNGGTVLSTGDMQEEFKSSNNQNIIQMSLSTQVNADDSVVIVDENGNAVFAFKTDRQFSALGYSSEDLSDETYTVYSGTDITGTVDENGIYTKVDSFNADNLTKQENSGRGMGMQGGPQGDFENRKQRNEQKGSDNQYFIIVLGVCGGLLVLTIIIAIVSNRKKKKSDDKLN